jgi:hypothetical protein
MVRRTVAAAALSALVATCAAGPAHAQDGGRSDRPADAPARASTAPARTSTAPAPADRASAGAGSTATTPADAAPDPSAQAGATPAPDAPAATTPAPVDEGALPSPAPEATVPQPPAATAPTDPAAPEGAAADTGRADDEDDGISPLLVGAAVIAGLALIGLAAWALVWFFAWQPAWLAGARHAVAEAGYRVSGLWEDFLDWLRGGRSAPR